MSHKNPTNSEHLQHNKAGAGERMSHNQMERNFHNDRDKAERRGESTTPPHKHGEPRHGEKNG